MCGIFACLTDEYKSNDLERHFYNMKHRGPDNSTLQKINNVYFGFHRLAIIDPSPASDQPLHLNGCSLICNGEIFNYKQLIQSNEFKMITKSDCEVILHLYHKYGIQRTLDMLDAEFTFVLYDTNKNIVYTARDPYGVRPLFIGYDNKNRIFISSEVKGIHEFCKYIEPFKPGCFVSFTDKTKEESKSSFVFDKDTFKYIEYFDLEFKCVQTRDNVESIMYNIKDLFTKAVEKRLMSDRPIGCLLSGGLDSSLVTSIVSKNLPNLHCFSIGLEGGVDIEAAKKVTKFLNIDDKHHIVNFTVEEGMEAIKEVIYHLESYDITTVRASTPQYLLAKYISQNTDIKVLYSGEGADELFAGYQYSKDAPSAEALHNDTKKLLRELYIFDNLRTDRTTAAWGLEVRVPFLDKEFTRYVMTLDPELRRPYLNKPEKILLRNSFNNGEYLPKSILYRPKEAFSDAVSSKEKSWYRTLISKIELIISDKDLQDAKYKYPVNTPQTKEALYYRNIFNCMYENRDNLINHIWMPEWQGNILDPSATVLKCHQGDLEIKNEDIDNMHTHYN